MIHATADEVASILAADHEMLRQMGAFLDAVTGDADVGPILAALPEMIAKSSPFEDERALVAVVQRETLQALHALALSRLPARGSA